MADIVNEPPGAKDAVVQIKPESEDGGWSHLNNCTMQLETVSSSQSLPRITRKNDPVECDPDASVDKHTVHPSNVINEPNVEPLNIDLHTHSCHIARADVSRGLHVNIEEGAHFSGNKVSYIGDPAKQGSLETKDGKYDYIQHNDIICNDNVQSRCIGQ